MTDSIKPIKKIFWSLTLSLSIILGLQSSFISDIKPVKFQRSQREVVTELKKLNNFEKADIQSGVEYANDSTKITLIVNLFNGEDLTVDEDGLWILGKKALNIVTASIENEDDYDTFKVVFEEKKKIGFISRGFKKSYIFKFEDLQ